MNYRPLLVYPLLLWGCGDSISDELKIPDVTVAYDLDYDGDGFTENQGDCNDFDATVHPEAIEVCDYIDNDCDELVDDRDDNRVTDTVWYLDADGDFFGGQDFSITACEDPSAFNEETGKWDIYWESSDDCNDADATIFPSAEEVCDGVDNNCDGLTDDEDESVDPASYIEVYPDQDGDGYGVLEGAMMACSPPQGFALAPTDCDDTDPNVSPGAAEVCDSGIDNDCDGMVDAADDNLSPTNGMGGVFYRDYDQDGEGDINYRVSSCEQKLGYVSNSSDCNDFDASINTSDADGDGLTSCPNAAGEADCDDNDASIGSVDADGDGYIACIDDCDDNNAAVSPADADGDGLSACDGDCDDTDASVNVVDADGDGYSACHVDCNDSSGDLNGDGIADGAQVYPGAAVDEPHLCTQDFDGDGFGDQNINCLSIKMLDDYMDGWNGGSLEFYVDGTLINSLTMDDGSGVFTDVCAESGSVMDVAVKLGDYPEEISFELRDSLDVVLLAIDELDTYVEDEIVLTLSLGEAGTDCKDTDYLVAPLDNDNDGLTSCDFDCNDNNPTVGQRDDDGDGYIACHNDCNDTDPAINPGATEIWYDNVDQDCDGRSDFDQDLDGYIIDAWDFDGDGVPETFYDIDGDGVVDFMGGSDCNDTDPEYTGVDKDGDGYSICDDDCDDDDPNTYVGAAPLSDPNQCLTDADGDGYAALLFDLQCYTFVLTDGYGDGWNGGYIGVYENSSFYQQIAASASIFTNVPSSEEVSICFNGGSTIEFFWYEGTYDAEVGVQFMDEDGNVYFDQSNFSAYYNTESIFTMTVPSGLSDCDDSDASLYPGSGCP